MQNYTSKKTSINKTKLPAIYSKLNLKDQIILDIGCGKYIDHIKGYVNSQNGLWYGIDKYNQTPKHNEKTLEKVEKTGVTVIVISNVLNVIDDKRERLNVIDNALDIMGDYSVMCITIYEGDKSGIGRETMRDCFQNNQPIKFYEDEIKKEFPALKIYKKNGMLKIYKG